MPQWVCPAVPCPFCAPAGGGDECTQLKAAAQCTAELWGLTSLAFSGCLHWPCNQPCFHVGFACNKPQVHFIYSVRVRQVSSLWARAGALLHPPLVSSLLWRRGWSSSNAHTNSCSVIAITPLVCFIGKHGVWLRPALHAKGFLRCAEHLSASLSSAGVDSSKYLAGVSTWHLGQVRQSAFYACQDVILLVLIHSPVSFLAEKQLLHLIKPVPSSKQQHKCNYSLFMRRLLHERVIFCFSRVRSLFNFRWVKEDFLSCSCKTVPHLLMQVIALSKLKGSSHILSEGHSQCQGSVPGCLCKAQISWQLVHHTHLSTHLSILGYFNFLMFPTIRKGNKGWGLC